MTTLAWVALSLAPTVIAVSMVTLLLRFSAARPKVYSVPRVKDGGRVVFAYHDGLVDPRVEGAPGVAIAVYGDPREMILPLWVVDPPPKAHTAPVES